ncbi:thiamine pyrophosphate-dependent enzyme [Mycobacterium sp. 050134]|uniref:thiamine pyrophosphate-dependent enzyme n=1 Tax=Mycobacterium sp. 050134 TaxID=3096111 RepID=UPI002EDB38F0
MRSGLVLNKPRESLITDSPSPNPDACTAGKRGTAAEAVIRTLIRHPSFGDGTGFHFLSGNAGSNEGPIWQAIQDVTGLKGLVHGATEFIAMCMASGFEVLAAASADDGTKKIPVLALHAQVGVKYGAAGLDFLVRQRQPCLLLIGDAGRLARQYGGHNSVPDYRGLLKQLGVKSVHFPVEEEGPQGLVPAVQAAMTAVMSEPYGSVAVILDENLLNTIADIAPAHVATPPLMGTSGSGTPTAETEAAIVRAAELLVNKQRPVLVLNQEVGRSPGARKAAERLASLTGAHVVACYAPGTVFDRGHPSWCGNLSFGEADDVANQIAGYAPDAIAVVGGPFPNNVWPNGRSEVPDGVPAVVVSPDESDRTRCNILAEVFVRANVGIALTGLVRQLEARRTQAQQQGAKERLDQIAEENRTTLDSRIAGYEKHMDETPVHPARIAKELALALRTRADNGKLSLEDVAIFDEALTSSGPFLDYVEHLGLHNLFYYGTPGPTLGAHGASLGCQAAAPNQLVISLFGDGGADFNDAAFIVAARENLPVKHLMIDNGGYELVSQNFARDARLRGENAEEQLAAGRVLPLHAQHPIHQNRAFQVRGFVSRASQKPVFDSAYLELPEQVAPAIEAMLDSNGPFLLQVITQGVHFQPANK